MNNTKRKKTKNQQERTQYWKSAREQNHIDPTGIYGSSNLNGSDETAFPSDDLIYQKQNTTAPASLKTRFKRNKDSVIKWIATAIIVPVLGYCAVWLINTNADVQVIKQRISTIEEKISAMDESMVTTEVLDLKLEIIKRDVTALVPDTSGIMTRLNEIETRIAALDNEEGAVSK